MRLRCLLSFVLLVALTSGCGGSKNPMNPDGGGPSGNPSGGGSTLPHGSMSARIDGAHWAATVDPTIRLSGGIVSVAGSNLATTLAFAIFTSGPGTFPIPATGLGAGTNALLNMTTAGGVPGSWKADVNGGTGTIVINSYTSAGMSGTFSFVMQPVPGSGVSGTKTVTDGKFDLKF
jgi:hypothetical protein